MSMIRALRHDAPEDQDARDASLPHVLLVVDQFSRTLGGGERIALKLAALLPQYGYRASILTFSIDPESAYLESLPCPVYLLPLQSRLRYERVAGGFRIAKTVPKTAEGQDRPDILRDLRSLGWIRGEGDGGFKVDLEPQRYGDSSRTEAPRGLQADVGNAGHGLCCVRTGSPALHPYRRCRSGASPDDLQRS